MHTACQVPGYSWLVIVSFIACLIDQWLLDGGCFCCLNDWLGLAWLGLAKLANMYDDGVRTALQCDDAQIVQCAIMYPKKERKKERKNE